jgi:hypothetical protein
MGSLGGRKTPKTPTSGRGLPRPRRPKGRPYGTISKGFLALVATRTGLLRRGPQCLARTTPIGSPNKCIAPCCVSVEKPKARFFAPLRCAQNDSMADECTDVLLSAPVTVPLSAHPLFC